MNVIFLCSMPRAGNTVLGSIINQNKKIKATPNSIMLDVLEELNKLKEKSTFKNFPDHKSLDNLIKSSFSTYYKDWKAELIIDRGPWGTPGNLNNLKKVIKKPKFIILYRPVKECLASFAKILKEDKKVNNVDEHLINLLNKETGILGKALWSINNLIKNKENYKIFYYKDLVNNPDLFLKNISKYIKYNIKYDLKKLKQFNVNNICYDDSETIKNLHKIKTTFKNFKPERVEDYLTNDMIKHVERFELNEFI